MEISGYERLLFVSGQIPETAGGEVPVPISRARVGQGRFRKDLLDYWQGACAVTLLRLPDILKASHIKPWRVSSNAERLDPFNGLLLLPQYDELFDSGWISFLDDGTMLVSRILAETSLALLGVQEGARLSRVEPRHRVFLGYHRKWIFWHEEKVKDRSKGSMRTEVR